MIDITPQYGPATIPTCQKSSFAVGAVGTAPFGRLRVHLVAIKGISIDYCHFFAIPLHYPRH